MNYSDWPIFPVMQFPLNSVELDSPEMGFSFVGGRGKIEGYFVLRNLIEVQFMMYDVWPPDLVMECCSLPPRLEKYLPGKWFPHFYSLLTFEPLFEEKLVKGALNFKSNLNSIQS